MSIRKPQTHPPTEQELEYAYRHDVVCVRRFLHAYTALAKLQAEDPAVRLSVLWRWRRFEDGLLGRYWFLN